ncbi:MAG: tRNA pseudouridine(13) synthase TruD [Planctomycetes bacterium]|nr:tRNA pseudouridine(13) synthase TruD [Planctomycetota bacterium]
MPRSPKLKRLPDDFVVEELSELPLTGGEFAVYRLRKRSLGTMEAMDLVARTWNLPRASMAWGGLKDRHAITEQLVTIRGGLREDLQRATVDLRYLGQARRPISAQDLSGNRFRIVLRDFAPGVEPAVDGAIAEVAKNGILNLFDDQRFRSVGPSGEYIAHAWCEERYERALWLAFAEENEADTAEERREKQILRDLWGKWTEAKAALTRSHRRSVITYLADHPTDFRGAFEIVRRDLRSLWLSAWQSSIWNRALEEAAKERTDLESLAMPLPSARTEFDDASIAALFERVLAPMGLSVAKLKIRHGRDVYFARGKRTAIARPGELRHEWADDELYPNRRKLTLSFTLGRGSYATLVVKRIQAAAQ